jgi:hypothetical protein
VHFGLGTADQIEGIEVRWPDGAFEQFTCDRVDQTMEVVRGRGRLLSVGAEVEK